MRKLFLKNFLKQRNEKLIELTYQQLAALFGIGSVFPWPLGMTASLKSLLHQMSYRLQQNITCTLYFTIHHSYLYHCCSLKCTCIIKDQLKDFDFVFQFTVLLILYCPSVSIDRILRLWLELSFMYNKLKVLTSLLWFKIPWMLILDLGIEIWKINSSDSKGLRLFSIGAFDSTAECSSAMNAQCCHVN